MKPAKHQYTILNQICTAHHHFAAEEFYGREFIEQKIKEQRQKKVKRSEFKQTVQMT